MGCSVAPRDEVRHQGEAVQGQPAIAVALQAPECGDYTNQAEGIHHERLPACVVWRIEKSGGSSVSSTPVQKQMPERGESRWAV